MAENNLRQSVGQLAVEVIQSALGKEFDSEALRRLRVGNLDVARDLSGEISRYAHLGNPFYGDLRTVAKSLTGAQIMSISARGGIESGLIAEVAAYTGEGDPASFTLHQREPGTIGIWTDPRRGGYSVACVSAHPQGEAGYLAILEVKTSSERLGMNDIAVKFGFDQLAGTSLLDSKSKIKIAVRNPRNNYITDELKVVSSTKKGAECIAAYKLA